MLRIHTTNSPWAFLVEITSHSRKIFNEELAYVRALPGARYRSEITMWQVPLDVLPNIWETFGYEADWKLLPWEFGLTTKPLSPDSIINTDNELSLFKGDVFNFQTESASFLYQRKKAIVGDDVGLGKTITGIRALLKGKLDNSINRALVITRAGLKYQWLYEIERFTDLNVLLIDGPAKKRKELWKDADKHFVVIVNYDLLICDDFTNMQAFGPEALIFDEIHYLKNHKAKRTKQAVKLVKNVDYCWGLSATPTTGKLEEVWSLFQFVDSKMFGVFSKFSKQYCVPAFRSTASGYRFSGYRDYKNRPTLNYVTKPYLLVRSAEDVSNELPEVIEIERKIYPSSAQRKLFKRLENHRNEIKEKLSKSHDAEEISKLEDLQLGIRTLEIMAAADTSLLLGSDSSYSRRLAAGITPSSPKLDELLELALMWTSVGHKFLVFTEFVKMAEKISDRLSTINYESDDKKKRLKSYVITGEVSRKKQGEIINEFKELEGPAALVLDRAGQEGLNLQVAKIVCLFDPPWNPNDVQQRLGRIRRMSSEHDTVRLYSLITIDSIDETILELHNKRKANILELIGGSHANSL